MQEVWRSQDLDQLKEFIQGYDVEIIDEAQRIPGLGAGLKTLIDADTSARLAVTGSASFVLSGQIGEPLTGRRTTLLLYPVAMMELAELHNPFESRQRLGEHPAFGTYPEILNTLERRGKIELWGRLCGPTS